MAKSLPPWLMKGKDEAPPPKGGKMAVAKGPKGVAAKGSVPIKKVDGGNVKAPANKAVPAKAAAKSDPKLAANKNSKPLHLNSTLGKGK
jgi:hypothetical protein